MTRFDERLRAAVARYRELQTPDGGWGEDRFENAPTSIVNTVEVLAVMRAARVRYTDDCIQAAMAYLRRAVVDHPKPEGSTREARGVHVRYCAWGLAGLTMYEQARHDRDLVPAHAHCVSWLARHELANGAWGEHSESEHPSLLSTSAAIRGLHRLCSFHPCADESQGLLRTARRQVRALANTRDSHASWAQAPTHRRSSPAATALAVLSLVDGQEEDRAMARAGGRWLLANASSWRTHIEPDSSARKANWHHMSFSLGLRATLLSDAAKPDHRALADAFAHMDELWSEEDGEWSHGTPGARPSPSGSYAIVLAHDAIGRAWSFDAREVLHSWSAPPRRRAEPAEERIEIDDDGSISVIGFDGRLKAQPGLTPVLHRMFLELARRHHSGADERTLEARSLTTQDLVLRLNVKAADSVRRYAGRINERIKANAEARGEVVGDLVQQMSSDGHSERRWVLNVDRVVVSPEQLAMPKP